MIEDINLYLLLEIVLFWQQFHKLLKIVLAWLLMGQTQIEIDYWTDPIEHWIRLVLTVGYLLFVFHYVRLDSCNVHSFCIIFFLFKHIIFDLLNLSLAMWQSLNAYICLCHCVLTDLLCLVGLYLSFTSKSMTWKQMHKENQMYNLN